MTNKEPELQIDPEGPVNRKGKDAGRPPHGLLANFFGGVENAPTSISGAVVLLLIMIGAAISFLDTKVDPTDYWKAIVLPTTTGLFGYLFGKGKK